MQSKQDRDKLIKIFLEKNNQINLSAIRDYDGVYNKHILDSIELTKIIEFPSWSKVFDIWTWWGFPLIPLAILYPDSNFIWIDSIKKKTVAVQEIASALGLKNVDLIRTRAEDYKDQCDYLVSRAVAYIDKLISWTYNLVKDGWYMIFYKQFTMEEKDDLESICRYRKIKIVKQHVYSLFPWDIQRVIYVLQK